MIKATVRDGPHHTTNVDKKDIMPANGYSKPFTGINLLKNRIQVPQIFSTRKRRGELVHSVNIVRIKVSHSFF